MADQRSTAYDLLGVSPRASAAEITNAYRRELRRHHPDSRDSVQASHPADPACQRDAADALRTILDAYAVLRDPVRRADYDRRLAAVKRPTPPPGPAANHELLLAFSPVSWQAVERPAGRSQVGQYDALALFLHVLRSHWR